MGSQRLLTILRSAVPNDEIEIIQNLYSDDEEFAEFIVSKIFSLELFPLLYRKGDNFIPSIIA